MDAKEADFVIEGFRFASGGTLPEMKLHYRTLGRPDRGPGGEVDNAVLMLHGTTGSGKQFLQPDTADFLFGAGQPLDAAKYLILSANSGGGLVSAWR